MVYTMNDNIESRNSLASGRILNFLNNSLQEVFSSYHYSDDSFLDGLRFCCLLNSPLKIIPYDLTERT
jgi:hypothetical protein